MASALSTVDYSCDTNAPSFASLTTCPNHSGVFGETVAPVQTAFPAPSTFADDPTHGLLEDKPRPAYVTGIPKDVQKAMDSGIIYSLTDKEVLNPTQTTAAVKKALDSDDKAEVIISQEDDSEIWIYVQQGGLMIFQAVILRRLREVWIELI